MKQIVFNMSIGLASIALSQPIFGQQFLLDDEIIAISAKLDAKSIPRGESEWKDDFDRLISKIVIRKLRPARPYLQLISAVDAAEKNLKFTHELAFILKDINKDPGAGIPIQSGLKLVIEARNKHVSEKTEYTAYVPIFEAGHYGRGSGDSPVFWPALMANIETKLQDILASLHTEVFIKIPICKTVTYHNNNGQSEDLMVVDYDTTQFGERTTTVLSLHVPADHPGSSNATWETSEHNKITVFSKKESIINLQQYDARDELIYRGNTAYTTVNATRPKLGSAIKLRHKDFSIYVSEYVQSSHNSQDGSISYEEDEQGDFTSPFLQTDGLN